MGSFGIGDVLEDEVVWSQRMYSMDTYLRFRSSSFLVKESLLPAELGEGLAGEAGDVDMDPALLVDVWVMPGVFSDFQWGEVFPDEGSGF